MRSRASTSTRISVCASSSFSLRILLAFLGKETPTERCWLNSWTRRKSTFRFGHCCDSRASKMSCWELFQGFPEWIYTTRCSPTKSATNLRSIGTAFLVDTSHGLAVGRRLTPPKRITNMHANRLGGSCDRPDHLALSHPAEAGRWWYGCGLRG
jgi:hypothetical protein